MLVVYRHFEWKRISIVPLFFNNSISNLLIYFLLLQDFYFYFYYTICIWFKLYNGFAKFLLLNYFLNLSNNDNEKSRYIIGYYSTSISTYVYIPVRRKTKYNPVMLVSLVSELMSFDTFFQEGISIPEIQHWTRYI